jgi:multidrug efflux pump subunit AcrA (membrane-fusion protein)
MLAEDLAHFPTLRSLKPPAVLRSVAILVVVAVAGIVLLLMFVPWVQTAQGQGRVTALEPRDRVQDVSALMSGRVAEWYVIEGLVVQEGDPIARIVDNDPQFVERLKAERAQMIAEGRAVDMQIRVAQRDVQRMRTLVAEGLNARQDLEAAELKVADYRAKLAQIGAKVAQMDVRLDRQQAQIVRAPRNGVIQQMMVGDTASFVKEGDVLVTFAPDSTNAVVEIFVDGLDVPFIEAGQRVRLEFEGWPAVQVSGWPSIARGLFDGVVFSVDAAPAPSGLYRVLVAPAADRPAWPSEPAVRLGAKTRGWILMDTVTVGYEIWRQLNDFPLQFQRPIDREQVDPGAAPKGEKDG